MYVVPETKVLLVVLDKPLESTAETSNTFPFPPVILPVLFDPFPHL